MLKPSRPLPSPSPLPGQPVTALGSLTGDSVERRILRATLTVGAVTLLTKMGFVARDLIVAWRFGRSPMLDAFLLAFVVPFSLTNAISASLKAAFLPDFIQLQQGGKRAAAQQLYGELFGWLLLVSGAAMLLCVLTHPLYVHVVAASLSVDSWHLMRNLLFLTAPAAFLSAVASFWQSIFDAEEKFFLGSSVFVATPLISIGLLFFSVNTGVIALSLGLLLGGAVEVFALGLALGRKGVSLLPRLGGPSPAVRHALSQWAPFFVGVLLVNAMSVVDNAMAARLAAPGSVAALNYGRKAVTLPLDLSSIAFATATAPYFSKMAAAHDWAGLRKTLRRCLAVIFALNVPVVLMLVVGAKPIVRLLFERGQFGPQDTQVVAGVLSYYAFSLPFCVAFLTMMKLLSSLRAGVTSVWFSAAALALNIVFNYLLSKLLGVAGIGLASACVYFILIWILYKYIGDHLGAKAQRDAGRTEPPPSGGTGRKLMKTIAQKTLLLCAALTVSLLLAELIISAVKPQDLSGTWGEQTERGLVVNKSSGGARHQFGPRVVSYTFTAPHLRAPAPTASVRVLVLGDSYAFGYLLGDSDAPVSLLQRRLDDECGPGVFSLLNAAVGGWGAGDYVAFVEDFGEEVAPDIILVFLNTDDIGRALRSPLWKFSPADAKLTRVTAQRNRLKVLLNGLTPYQWLLEHSHLAQLLRNQAERFAKKPSRREPAPPAGQGPEDEVESGRLGKALGAALFRRLSSWCTERNVQLLIATTGWHKPPYANSSEPTEAFMSGAEAFFTDLGVPFSDPSNLLRQRMSGGDSGMYVIRGDGHPNEAGAALIAEHAYPFLKSQLSDYCRLTGRCRKHGV